MQIERKDVRLITTMRSKIKASRRLLVSVMLVLLYGCMTDPRYLSFIPIEKDGWDHTDTLTYSIPPLAGIGNNGIHLLFHTEGYEYRNIAIDVAVKQDSSQCYNRQISYLLDEMPSIRGIGRRCDYKLPVDDIVLCDTLSTMITLVHGMKDTKLLGVRKVGILVEESADASITESWNVDWND